MRQKFGNTREKTEGDKGKKEPGKERVYEKSKQELERKKEANQVSDRA